jgi:hypothetical protein
MAFLGFVAQPRGSDPEESVELLDKKGAPYIVLKLQASMTNFVSSHGAL